MIKKIGHRYVMNELLVPTITRQELTGPDRLVLRITSSTMTRQTCGSCGLNDRPDILSIQASPIGKDEPRYWICDNCTKREAPDLYEELQTKLRAENVKLFGEEEVARLEKDKA
ncbi:MAG: hypothetical protein ABSG19_14945 [Candidatus Aminicenantales bacterium]